ncbi:MAG: HAD-IC family P-type ATPase [Candidatus Paceibacterota bacterium]
MYPKFSKIATHTLSKEQVLVALQSDQMGLEEQERKNRLAQFGYNEIADKEKLSRLKIFLRQFQSPIIYILLVATAITLFLQDYKDALFIFAAALVNAVLGYYQEQRAESALEGLKKYIQEKAIVLIDGKETEVDAKNLVPGDIVRLRAGSKVPADARIILKTMSMQTKQSSQGVLAAKENNVADQPDAALADRSSMVFAGSVITQGYANVAVVATGAETEIGKIAHLVKNQKDEKTPLQNALYKFSLKASVGIFALSVGIFLVAINSGEPLLQAFLISVAVLVAAVPEGLPIVMTIILATGVQRLAKKNGIVRQLSAAETLGSTTVILTDKTGTLTQAKMRLANIRSFSKIKSELTDEQFILSLALLSADITIQNPNDDASMWQIAGKSLEVSLAKEAAIAHKSFLPRSSKPKGRSRFPSF